MCSNGIAGVQSGAACCEEKCGLCGGFGCGNVSGTAGESSCCSSTIIESGVGCDYGVEAPCFIRGYTPAPAAIGGVLMPFGERNKTNLLRPDVSLS